MLNQLKHRKYRESRLFITDYNYNVLVEAVTFSDLKRKITKNSNMRKFREIGIDPLEAIWIWFNHPLYPMFIEYRSESATEKLIYLLDPKRNVVTFGSERAMERFINHAHIAMPTKDFHIALKEKGSYC